MSVARSEQSVRARGRTSSWYYVAIAAVVACRYGTMVIAHFWSLSLDRGGLAPNPSGLDDGDYYWTLAQALADGWITDSANIFPVVLGRVMALTGIRDIVFYKHINLLIGLGVLAAAVSVYRSFVPPEHRRSEIFVIVLIGFYPSALVFEHVSLYRDGWIFLLHMLALLLCVKVPWKEPAAAVTGGITLAAVLVCLALFRWYVPVSALVGTGLWLCWRRLRRLNIRFATTLIVVLCCLALALIVPIVYSGAFGMFDSELLLRALDYRSGETEGAGSSLGISFRNVNSATVVPLFAYSVASNIWGPLPWQISSANTLAAFLAESSMMIAISFFLWRWRSRLTEPVVFLAFQAAAWFAAIGFFNDNLGTALRLRVLGWHIALVLFAVLRDSNTHSLRPESALHEMGSEHGAADQLDACGE